MPANEQHQAHLSAQAVQAYLGALFRGPVRLLGMAPLGQSLQEDSLKEYGYGRPVELAFEINGQRRRAVLHTMKPGPFGHEHMADRAAELLWSHDAFNRLPQHVCSLDVGGFHPNGTLMSLGRVDEVFLLTQYVDGREYAHDLVRLRKGGALIQRDLDRADALCDYLVQIHTVKGSQRDLYVRRVRELVGHGQCIMGLIDSYPANHPWITPALLESIEKRAVAWRWRLKDRHHRLAQVHGDFHPWNILFEPETLKFWLLDRSRGEWGDPVDDVTSLTLNYVFESLQATGQFQGAFAGLFNRFWARYLERSGDRELLEVAGPFVVFRGLVMASPIWYPRIDESVRRGLVSLIHAALDSEVFEPERIHEYLQTPIR